MGNFWQDVKKSLQEGLQSVSSKTEELTKIGRLKLEIIAVKRDIEKSFVELGGRVYDIINQEQKVAIKKDTNIIKLVEKVRGFEQKLADIEKEIERIQELKESGDQDKS